MFRERQLPLFRTSHRRSPRRPKRLNLEGRQRETERWWAQKMLEPFLMGAQNFPQLTGSAIAAISRYNVEGISPAIDEAEIMEEIGEAIKAARRAGIPAKDVIEKFYKETRSAARRTEDQYSWTDTYFVKLVDEVVKIYPIDEKYGQDMKRRAFS